MNSRVFVVLLFLLSFRTVSAQVDLNRIDRYLKKTQQMWEVPGMAVGIVKDGELVFSKGYGTKKVGSKDAPDGNTLYAVASNSKAFTATALALLVQEGRLSWNDRVKDYLPYFELYDEYVTAHTTIEDILSHRVGLGTFSGDIIWYLSDLDPEEILIRVSNLDPEFDYRDGYGYSNVMYVAAGEVIRSITGDSWHEYIRKKLLKPLGMDRTVTSINELESVGNYATPHAFINGENVPIDWTNWDAVGAIGGLISSVNDMSKWVRFNLNHGIWEEDTLLSPASRNRLWMMHNSYEIDRMDGDNATHFRGYGLGWTLMDYHGRLRVGHSGGYDGMITYVQMIPDENVGVIVLTNGLRSPITAVANYILDAYLGLPETDYASQYLQRAEKYDEQDTRIEDRKAARIEGTQPSLPLEAYEGTYFADIYGTIDVYEKEGQLHVSFEHTPDFDATLSHWHYDTWKINFTKPIAWFSFGTVQFQMNHLQKVEGMTFDVPNDDIWFYELKPVKIK